MDTFDLTRLIIGVVITLWPITFFLRRTIFKNNTFTSKFIARSAIFSAISIILYIVPIFKFPLPFFPAFLEIHFDEVPILIAGFAYGPMTAVLITIIKTLVKLPLTSTLGVGELADLIYTLAFVVPTAIIYKRKRTLKNSLIAILIGSLVQLIVSSFVTSFLILNFYMFVMGLSEATILAMCQAVNPAVTSLGFTFLLFVALPFNAFKDMLIIILTYLLYKRLHKFIDLRVEKN